MPSLNVSEKQPSRICLWSLFFVIMALICLQISATAISVCLILSALLSVIAQRPQKIIGCIKANFFVIFLVLLSVVLFIGIWRNEYSQQAAWHEFGKYVGKFIVFMCIFPIFTYSKCRIYVFNGIIIVASVASVLFFICVKGYAAPIIKTSYVFSHMVNAIPWSYFLAVSAFIVINQILDQPEFRVARILISLWLLYVLFFINIERSGMLAMLLLIGILLYQRLALRRAMLATVLLIIAVVVLYLVSSNIQIRIHQFLTDISHYFSGAPATGSIDLRLAFAANSWTLIKQKFLLGHGTGSFPFAYHSTGGPSLPGVALLGDPHNTFIHLWVQIGLLGLALFVLFLVSQTIESYKLPYTERRIAQGLTFSFTFMCLCVSALFRQRLVVFYFITLLTCFGARPNILNVIKRSTR